MNDHVHPIFQQVLNRFAPKSPKEYYSMPYDTLDDDSYGAFYAYEQQLQEQDEQQEQ